jgi:large subunit ribosomal protein L10
MPNAKVLSEKQAIVEALAKRLSEAESGLFIDYKGITVAEDSKLRRELAEAGVEYNVVKNTLVKFALDKTGLSGVDHVLCGTTSMATSTGDPIAPFRIIKSFSDKMGDRFNVKAAFMDGQVLSESATAELAKLPGKDALYSIVFGTMLAPITSLAVVLAQIVEKNGGSVESAEAEAPAEEVPAAE